MKVNPPISGAIPDVPFEQGMPLRNVGWIDPRRKGKTISGSDIKSGTRRDFNICILVIEQEGIPHLAGREVNPALQYPVVATHRVIAITFT